MNGEMKLVSVPQGLLYALARFVAEPASGPADASLRSGVVADVLRFVADGRVVDPSDLDSLARRMAGVPDED